MPAGSVMIAYELTGEVLARAHRTLAGWVVTRPDEESDLVADKATALRVLENEGV